MSSTSTHTSMKLLLIFNVIQIILGLLSLILSLVQFSPSALDNASLIDFRYLNTIHILTGAIGVHMICNNFGSVLAKTSSALSFILSLWTLCFFGDTIGQESSQYESMKEIRRLDGGQELVTDEMMRSHMGKLAVCSLMIILAIFGIVISGGSFLILERMHTENQVKPYMKPVVTSANRRRRQQMACVALMKICCSLATVCLGSYLEALYKNKSGFIKIGWHILAGSITFFGACIDLRALYGGRGWNLLNLKISLLFSVASAVLSIKALDYSMSNYFVADVREYSRYDELKMELQTALNGVQVHTDSDKREAFVKFVVHAAVIGSLALSFAHSVISAVEASSYIEKTGCGKSKSSSTIKISSLDNSRSIFGHGTVPAPNFRYHGSALRPSEDDESDEMNIFVDYDENLHKHKSCSGIFQCVCGLALISLCVISLVSWDFSRGYDGGAGVLWLGCLFIASGLINANRPKTFTTSVYVLSVISSVLSFERAMYSLNVIYQAARNPRFQAELNPTPTDPGNQQTNFNAHTGRITLYSIEAAVLIFEFIASTWLCIKFTRAIRDMPRSVFTQSKSLGARAKGALCSFGFFHLLYAFVTIAVSIAAEVALWSYNVHVSSLVYSTNGVVVFAAVFVQWMASQHFQFLLASAIMNAVTASIGFFVMAPAMRDLYTLVAGYRSTYENSGHQYAAPGGSSDILDAELKAKPIQEWIIGMNALIVLLALLEFVISVISGMVCSYLLHHAYEPKNGSVSTLRFPSLPSHLPRYWAGTNGALYGRAYSTSSSVNGLDSHHFVNPSTKISSHEDRGFVNTNNEFPFYGRRSMHTLNRVVYPTMGNPRPSLGNGQGHYGSLPSLHHYAPGGGNGSASGRRDNFGSLTVERGGCQSRYAYY